MSRNLSWVSLGLAVLVVATIATPTADAVAPGGKHYAGMLVVIAPASGEVEAEPVCMTFSRRTFCTEIGDCGPWQITDRQRRQNEWAFELEYMNGDGQMIRARGKGMTERGGPGSSVAAIVLFTLDGVEMNGSFAGVKTTHSRCMEFGTQDD